MMSCRATRPQRVKSSICFVCQNWFYDRNHYLKHYIIFCTWTASSFCLTSVINLAVSKSTCKQRFIFVAYFKAFIILFVQSIANVWHISQCCRHCSRNYIIISKNIRYLLWNRGALRFFHDTYLAIEVRGIRCTNHLHDSCPLTDINSHFTAPGCRYYFEINSWWPIVTSSTHGPAASYCDITMIHCSHGYLWTHDVEVERWSRTMAWQRWMESWNYPNDKFISYTSLFTFLFIFRPRFSTRDIASYI